jgi:hypothetical protein
VPLGKYCLSRPLVFSFDPSYHGPCGSQWSKPNPLRHALMHPYGPSSNAFPFAALPDRIGDRVAPTTDTQEAAE